ncbi:DJ-1/PfpI family protein [uncultured Tateyamaria sp.]|uniref:DJ-1/PfpI family protein n=1 Tax=uncultured Tateyamaria sp. TaxID=455651 RepID=UPI00262ACC9C|nr:DJ-1/PfpI family protein [uncultured Tateyamaria sp.]
MIDRRQFTLAATAAMLGTCGMSRTAQAQPSLPADSPRRGLAPLFDPTAYPSEWVGDEQIVMLAYPGMTLLDLVGPQHMFAAMLGATVRIAAKTLDPIQSDLGMTIQPDVTFSDAHPEPDVIFTPGSIAGTFAAMEDAETVDFLATRGERAHYVTSVCTGAMLLGQAGLIDGYRVSTHWLAKPAMDAFGATATDERVTMDRNRLTGGGVTAGIDFGLTMVEELRGTDYAQSVQLMAEYAPAPPLASGTPDTAPPEVRDRMAAAFPGFEEHARAVAARRR